jgi:alanine racemase
MALATERRAPVRRKLDLGALGRNYERIVARLPPATRLICSVKANAYGHGVRTAVEELERCGADAVATASVDDAVALREAGTRCHILLFGGGHDPADARDLADHGIAVTVANADTARALMSAGRRDASVFVEVDCGLGRLGVPLHDAEALLHDLALRGNLRLEGIYTHLPFSDQAGEQWARAGLARFRGLVNRLRSLGFEFPVVQALSSPGFAAGLPAVGNAVCCGRLLYGVLPEVGAAAGWELEPVLCSVTARITHVRRYETDCWIGSSGRHHVRAGEAVGVIPFGRSEGNLVDVAEQAYALHRGVPAKVLSVSLEHAMLNLGTGLAEVGDEVTILGGESAPQISVEDLARWSHLDPIATLVALDHGTLS